MQGNISVNIQYTLVFSDSLNFPTFIPNVLCYGTYPLDLLLICSRHENAWNIFHCTFKKPTINNSTLSVYKFKNYKEPNSRVPNQQILSICLNGITYGYILYHWKEENNPHRNSVVVAVYRGHDFFKSGSKVRAKIQGKCTVTFR